MNRKIEIEKIAFKRKSKSELIEKSRNDFEKLVNNDSQVRQELPQNCKLKDIKFLKPKVSIILDSENDSLPFIEINFKLKFEKDIIGNYDAIFNLNGEIIDDYLILN